MTNNIKGQWKEDELESVLTNVVVNLLEAKKPQNIKGIPAINRSSFNELKRSLSSANVFISPLSSRYCTSKLSESNIKILPDNFTGTLPFIANDTLKIINYQRIKSPPPKIKYAAPCSMFYKSIAFAVKYNQRPFIIKTYIGINSKLKVIQSTTHPYVEFPWWGDDMIRFAVEQSRSMNDYWNVRATDSGVSIVFGVNQEEVKSLFFSRQEPISASGKKRPILHWVKAHKRRINEGIEIDIMKHMRGITEFKICGTHFEITQPTKKTGDNN